MTVANEYIPGNSPIHSMTPLAKIIWTSVVMILALLFNHPLYLLALFFSVLLVAKIAGVLKVLISTLKSLFLFSLILILLQVLFTKEGEVIFYITEYLPVTKNAVYLGTAMGLRMMAAVLSFLIFLLTTRFKDIIQTLTNNLKLPIDYVFIFMTALRFIPTFLNEIKQVKEAQSCRGCSLDGWNPLVKIKAYAAVALPLVLVSLQKADKLAMAMETRGCGSGPRTCYREQKMSSADLSLVFISILLAVFAVLARLNGYGTYQY